jgi:hypothetical protein
VLLLLAAVGVRETDASRAPGTFFFFCSTNNFFYN